MLALVRENVSQAFLTGEREGMLGTLLHDKVCLAVMYSPCIVVLYLLVYLSLGVHCYQLLPCIASN